MRPEPSRPPFALPRVALALRRRPRVRLGLVVVLALVVGLLVQRTVAGAEAVRAAWGPRERVVVAARDLPPGHAVEADDVRMVSLPQAAVPPGALDRVTPGRVVRALVLEGEVLVRRRLSAAGVEGVAALLPEGTRAVAVPVEAGTAPPLEVGQAVDLMAVVAGDGRVPQAGVLAGAAPVVDVGEHAVTVALDVDVVPRVTAALAAGAVTLVLVAGY
jgi:Flp pilus assembly protein CpaB